MADPVPTPAELAAWREAHALTVEGGSEWDEWARVAHREWPRLLDAVEALREGIAERDGQAKQMVDEQMDLAEEVATLRADLAAARALHAACADRLSEAVTQLGAWRTSTMADATGHMLRCTKVNGAWACAAGCAAARLAAVEALTNERNSYRDDYNRRGEELTRLCAELDKKDADLAAERAELGALKTMLGEMVDTFYVVRTTPHLYSADIRPSLHDAYDVRERARALLSAPEGRSDGGWIRARYHSQ